MAFCNIHGVNQYFLCEIASSCSIPNAREFNIAVFMIRQGDILLGELKL